ncbi:MAG: glycosyltransferase family 4 protein [Gordonibacter pamelaeae]|nr:glycosyltransferase family 4 protein [Gordonibacter pamelaeae]MBS4897146.1 glycosyltransferase family 4 protein [Gordonibacter pamelaeae]MBS6974286.1 glycosyltransferase family 4 protein [Eggerthellaceae bacterium]RDB61667.1 glycosyltransferase family 1 protein [Gordonibacter pamelaeae]
MYKILMIGPDSSRASGGMASVIRSLSKSETLASRFTILEFPSCKDGSLASRLFFTGVQYMRFIIKPLKADICHIHIASYSSTWRKLLYGKAAKLKGSRVVYHVHGAEYKKFFASLSERGQKRLRHSFSQADAVIVLSNSWKCFFENTLDLKNVVVINNSIDCAKSNFKHGFPASIAFVGRLGVRKGAYDLIKALGMLQSKGMRFFCTFAGDGEIEKLQEAAKIAGVSQSTQFTGWLGEEKVQDILSSSSIMVLPSYDEGFPVSIIEAMAAGNAVVSTCVGGIPEEVCRAGSVLIGPGDVSALACALEELLVDQDRAYQMADANQEYVLGKLDNKVVHTQLANLYLRLLDDDAEQNT